MYAARSTEGATGRTHTGSNCTASVLPSTNPSDRAVSLLGRQNATQHPPQHSQHVSTDTKVPQLDAAWLDFDEKAERDKPTNGAAVMRKGGFGRVFTGVSLRIQSPPPAEDSTYRAAWDRLRAFCNTHRSEAVTHDADGGLRIQCAVKRVKFEHAGELQHPWEHPNVIRVFGWCDAPWADKKSAGDSDNDIVIYVVMELGVRVLSDVMPIRDLPTHDKLAIVRDVCSAVQFLGTMSVVHRDIKTKNIVQGYDGRWKLIDFGLASTTIRGLWVLSNDTLNPEQGGGTPGWTDLVCMSDKHAKEYLELPQVLQGQIDVFSLGKLIDYVFGECHAEWHDVALQCQDADLFRRPTPEDLVRLVDDKTPININDDADNPLPYLPRRTNPPSGKDSTAAAAMYEFAPSGGGGSVGGLRRMHLGRRAWESNSNGLGSTSTVDSSRKAHHDPTPCVPPTRPPIPTVRAALTPTCLRMLLMHLYHARYYNRISLSQPQLLFRAIYQTMRLGIEQTAEPQRSDVSTVSADDSDKSLPPLLPLSVTSLYDNPAICNADVVVVKGHAGAGKSTLTRWLAREQVTCGAPDKTVVIVVPLKELRADEGVEAWNERQLASRCLNAVDIAAWRMTLPPREGMDARDPARRQAQEIQDAGELVAAAVKLLGEVGWDTVLWVLDGYDEVQTTMNDFLDRHVRRTPTTTASFMRRVLVTTRYSHDAGAFGPNAAVVHMQPWDEEDAERFLEAIQATTARGRRRGVVCTPADPSFLTMDFVKKCLGGDTTIDADGALRTTPLLLDLIVLGAPRDPTTGHVAGPSHSFASIILHACRQMVKNAQQKRSFSELLCEASDCAAQLLRNGEIVMQTPNPIFRVTAQRGDGASVCDVHHRSIAEVLFAFQVVKSAAGSAEKLRSEIRIALSDSNFFDPAVFASAIAGLLLPQVVDDKEVRELIAFHNPAVYALQGMMDVWGDQHGTTRHENRPLADAIVSFLVAVPSSAVACYNRIKDAVRTAIGSTSKRAEGERFLRDLEEACGRYNDATFLEFLYTQFGPPYITLRRAVAWANRELGKRVIQYCATLHVHPSISLSMMHLPEAALQRVLHAMPRTLATAVEVWRAVLRAHLSTSPSHVARHFLRHLCIIDLGADEVEWEALQAHVFARPPATDGTLVLVPGTHVLPRLWTQWLKRSPDLKRLTICKNTADDDVDPSAKVVMDILTSTKAPIEELVLDGIFSGDVAAVTQTVRTTAVWKRLKRLSLCHNGIGPAGCVSLCGALEACTALEVLSLSGNPIAERGRKEGIQALIALGAPTRPYPLQELYLDNIGLSTMEYCLLPFADALLESRLRRLSLRGNGLQTDDVRCVAKGIRKNMHLVLLDLANNDIDEVEGAKIFEAASKEYTIAHRVNFSGNPTNGPTTFGPTHTTAAPP